MREHPRHTAGIAPVAVAGQWYLNDFCRLIAEWTPCRIVVYVDDFVILHRQPYPEEQVEWMANKLDEEGLTLNREKTQVVDRNVKGAAFDFLGFSFQRVRGYYPKRRTSR